MPHPVRDRPGFPYPFHRRTTLNSRPFQGRFSANATFFTVPSSSDQRLYTGAEYPANNPFQSTANGTAMQIYECNGTIAQSWF
jgi:hypothetical protein